MVNRTNMFGYVGGDVTSLVDPTGLTVYLTSHEVAGLKRRHLALLIIPDDQSNPNLTGANRFHLGGKDDGLVAGKWYTTISAAPGSGFNLPNLESTRNRPEDGPCKNRIEGRVLPNDKSDDWQFINLLIQLDSVYGDNVPYYLPWANPGYNSNSFIAGILNAAKANWNMPQGRYPLVEFPLPSSVFGR